MKQSYAWKKGSKLSVNADVVGKYVDQLKKKHGEITPELLLKSAESTRSAIHSCFEWDNDEAAHQYRLSQARYILRSIITYVITSGDNKRPVRVWIPVGKQHQIIEDEDQTESTYKRVDEIMHNPNLRAQLLIRAWKELKQWRIRYEIYEELAEVFKAMDSTKNKIPS